jgi:cytosine/adenosine deaminase-related metal-dependent hydrolase
VTCYGSTDRHGAEGARAGLRENERFAKHVAADPLVHAMVGIHACFTVSADTLAAHADLARALGLGLHLHAAEDPIDTAAVSKLDRVGGLAPKTLLAHGVHLSDSERRCAVERGAWIVHNPRSNQQNAVGYARLRPLQGQVALGTDGMDGDLFAELRAAHLAGRVAHGPEDGVDAVAWLAGGNALADGLLCASVPPPAEDAVVLDYDPPTPLNRDNAAAHLLFGMSARHVRDVTVAGQKVLDRGQATRVDAAALRARAREEARRLWRSIV